MAKPKELPTQPSEEIRRIIRQVNLVERKALAWPHEFCPDAWIFDELELWVDEDLSDPLLPDEAEKKWLGQMRCFLYDALQKMPRDFREFIWGEVDPENYNNLEEDGPGYDFATVWKGTVRAALRYRQTRSLINQMELLVDLTGRIGESTINSQRLNLAQREHIGIKLAQLPESTIYRISDKGVLTIAPSGLLKAVNSKELGRLRRCKKCEKVFWAQRSDSKCCSPECNKTYNALESMRRRKEDKDHAWKQDMKCRAIKRAKKVFGHLKFTESDVDNYRKRFRKYPHRVISDYIVKACLENPRLTPEKVSIEKAIHPLRDFLLRRPAA